MTIEPSIGAQRLRTGRAAMTWDRGRWQCGAVCAAIGARRAGASVLVPEAAETLANGRAIRTTKIDVDYGPRKTRDVDDPLSFLSISCPI
jgi:hypothetical protein